MQTSQKSNFVYQVVVLRTNGDHLRIIESDDYDKCYSRWKELHTQWASCVAENKPFVVEEPVVVAFSPSMIYEIGLMPVTTQEMAAKNNNPYFKQMQEQGFSRTFPAQGRDLLG